MADVQDTINKVYEKTGFMQRYGGSLIITIVILLAYALTMAYFGVINNLRTIKANWVEDRCNPKYIPFAGIVQDKKGDEILEYAAQNFSGCTQGILRNIAGDAVAPLEYLADAVTDVFGAVEDGVSDVMSLTGRIRKAVGNEAGSVMSRFLNVMTPIIRTLIVAKNTGSQAAGTLTTGIYTLFGSFLTLKSLIGSIIELTIIVLIALAAFCILMWIIPFTWPVAATFTAIFVAIAVPFAIMLVVMLRLFNTRPSKPIPATPSSCFAPGTPIGLAGRAQPVPIEKVKVGSVLSDGATVTSVMTLSGAEQNMYELSGVRVTGKHMVFDESLGWINVDRHPLASLCPDYNSGIVHCICTSTKVIRIGDLVFADWDDITAKESQLIEDKCAHLSTESWDDNHIHTHLEGGFEGDTLLDLDDGQSVPIKDVRCGHILRFGERVLGTVISDGRDVKNVNKYFLGDEEVIAGPNFTVQHPELGHLSSFTMQSQPARVRYLYHLVTDRGSFHIHGFQFADFEKRLDRFTEEVHESQTVTANFYL